MLAEIATAGNGNYYSASNLNELFAEIDKMQEYDLNKDEEGEEGKEGEEKESVSEQETKQYFQDRFLYFAGIALLLLLMDSIIISRKNRLLKNFDVFKVKI